MRRDTFQAIADPPRREIIPLLARQPLNVNTIADSFEISRPAISKHVKILQECGLITIRARGRERYCEVRLEKLREVAAWIEQYRRFWTSKLDALDDYLSQPSAADQQTTDNNKGK